MISAKYEQFEFLDIYVYHYYERIILYIHHHFYKRSRDW